MPFDTNTDQSKSSVDGSKVFNSCAESKVPAEAPFDSEATLSKLSEKRSKLQADKMSLGNWMIVKNMTDHTATKNLKSAVTDLYNNLSYMALSGLNEQTYRNNHWAATQNYLQIHDSSVFKYVDPDVKKAMAEDYSAAECYAFRQICGSRLSLPDTAKMRELASIYMNNSDIVRCTSCV